MGQRVTIAVEGWNSKLKVTSNWGIESCNKLRLQFDLAEKFGLARHLKPLYSQQIVKSEKVSLILFIQELRLKVNVSTFNFNPWNQLHDGSYFMFDYSFALHSDLLKPSQTHFSLLCRDLNQKMFAPIDYLQALYV